MSDIRDVGHLSLAGSSCHISFPVGKAGLKCIVCRFL